METSFVILTVVLIGVVFSLMRLWIKLQEVKRIDASERKLLSQLYGELRVDVRDLEFKVGQLENPPLDVVITEKPIVISEEPQIEPAFYDDDWQIKKYKELANIQANLKVKGLL